MIAKWWQVMFSYYQKPIWSTGAPCIQHSIIANDIQSKTENTLHFTSFNILCYPHVSVWGCGDQGYPSLSAKIIMKIPKNVMSHPVLSVNITRHGSLSSVQTTATWYRERGQFYRYWHIVYCSFQDRVSPWTKLSSQDRSSYWMSH